MLRVYAADYVTLLQTIDRMANGIGNVHHQVATAVGDLAFDPDVQKASCEGLWESLKPLLEDAEASCKRLDLEEPIFIISKIREICSAPRYSIPVLQGMLHSLVILVEGQLRNRLLFCIPNNKAKHFDAQQHFGSDVDAKFPDAIYDIGEAGKCLALGRSTAVVCHLMRVVENGVKALANKLSAAIDTDQPWGAILNQVDHEIRSRKRSGVDVEELENISASLHAVKDAWRNPAMHSRSKYTEEEAEEIFNASGTFMRRLSQVI
jgi:hypothetical protein